MVRKPREAMASELKGVRIGGAERTVEADGGYFGVYVKLANHKEMRRDRRLAKNQNGKRQVVVVMRERDGRTRPAVFRSESAALSFITVRVLPGTSLMADEAASWNDLHGRFGVSRIDHSKLYSDRSGVYTNGAEEFSAGCAGPRSGITTSSPGPTSFGMLRKRRSARIIGRWTTGGRFARCPDWQWRRRLRWTGAGIGRGRLEYRKIPLFRCKLQNGLRGIYPHIPTRKYILAKYGPFQVGASIGNKQCPAVSIK